MKPQLFSHLRSGLIALGVMAGLSVPAMAGPAGFISPPAQPAASGPSDAAKATPIAWICSQGNRVCTDTTTGNRVSRSTTGSSLPPLGDTVRTSRNRNWNGNRGNWNNGGNWNNNGGNWNNGWNDDRRWQKRRYARRHYNRRPNIVFGLGIGVPAYRYADPYYDYNYVAPRRVYRRSYGLSEAHVAWCFDRWRSYRIYDNTYQPYYGPRKLCWSPYS